MRRINAPWPKSSRAARLGNLRKLLRINASSGHRQGCCELADLLWLKFVKDFEQRRSHAEIPLAVGAAAYAALGGMADQVFQLLAGHRFHPLAPELSVDSIH